MAKLFLSLTFVKSQPGMDHTMEEHMKKFGRSLEACPGLIRVSVLKERGKSTLLGMSIWENEESFDSAMRIVDVPPSIPIETFRKDLSSMQFFEI